MSVLGNTDCALANPKHDAPALLNWTDSTLLHTSIWDEIVGFERWSGVRAERIGQLKSLGLAVKALDEQP